MRDIAATAAAAIKLPRMMLDLDPYRAMRIPYKGLGKPNDRKPTDNAMDIEARPQPNSLHITGRKTAKAPNSVALATKITDITPASTNQP